MKQTEWRTLASAICPDGSITDTYELIELVKEMRYFFDRINEGIEEREQLQAELDEEIEAVAQYIKLLGERTQQNKQLQDDVRKLSRSLLIFENAISVRGAIAEADKAKLVEALELASQALHHVLKTRDYFAIRKHIDAVLKEVECNI